MTNFYSSIARCSLNFFLFFLFSSACFAQQNALNGISSAERSDGKGFVIRYQLSEKVDSFKVFQPTSDLIQMTLYGENLDTTGIAVPPANKAFDEISFYNIPFGIGVDVYIPEGTFFRANAYPDKNGNDLLLGLTYAEEKDLTFLTEDIDPVIWSTLSAKDERLLVSTRPDIQNVSLVDDGYRKVKDKIKFDVVVLDPGHGGHDTGAIGYKGTREKEVVLSIAKKVGDYIANSKELAGTKVVYTREDDSFVELEERGSIANRAEGDLFVSIHCNSNHSSQPYGSEVYFLGIEKSKTALDVMKRENSVIRLEDNSEKEELTSEDLLIYELANSGYIASSEKLAGMLEYQLDDRAQRRSRGVKQARFVVLYHASMPAILVETGFISNPGEQRYLTSDYGQAIIASAIFRAIRNYKEQYEKSQHFTTN